MKNATASARVEQIGPRWFIVLMPGHAPTTYHANGTSERATSGDVILLGVLDWYAGLEGSSATLWGERVVVEVRTRTNGRYYITARRACGEVRILDSATMLALAEAYQWRLSA